MTETTLLERNTAGLRVEVKYLPLMDEVALQLECGDWLRAFTVPKDKALEAFNHPMTFVGDDIPPAFMSPSVRAGLKPLTEGGDD